MRLGEFECFIQGSSSNPQRRQDINPGDLTAHLNLSTYWAASKMRKWEDRSGSGVEETDICRGYGV